MSTAQQSLIDAARALQQGQPEEAFTLADAACQDQPALWAGYLTRGRALLELGRNADAVSDLSERWR